MSEKPQKINLNYGDRRVSEIDQHFHELIIDLQYNLAQQTQL